jgi:type-F conjugative transfer system pilin assembly protein TrbC
MFKVFIVWCKKYKMQHQYLNPNKVQCGYLVSFVVLLFNILCVNIFCTQYTFADTAIVLDQQQLQETQAEIKTQGARAIAQIPNTQAQLSKIKIESLDYTSANVEVEQAKKLHYTKPLTTKLPLGDKYYLYSESMLQDNQQFLAQYKDGHPLDINKTIADYNAMLKNAKLQLGDNRLLIFISSSLPKQTIINLMQQSSPLGAVFVVRGLINNSYVKTYSYFYKLKGDNTVGIMLNPTLFKAMDIQLVPTFALYNSSQDLLKTACNTNPQYTKVAGEVTVHYALEQLRLSNIASLAQVANNELDILDSIKN